MLNGAIAQHTLGVSISVGLAEILSPRECYAIPLLFSVMMTLTVVYIKQ